jgi:hypothetical protein
MFIRGCFCSLIQPKQFLTSLYTIIQPQSTLPPVALNGLRSSPADNEVLTVIGFGTTFQGAMYGSFVLQEVNVSAVPDAVCNQQYGGDIEDEVMFCGGVSGGGKDSCQGDSGGPIMNSNGVQVGVVSWGQGCANEDYSGVYSRISGAIDWINEQICELSSNPPDLCNNSGNNGGENNSTGGNDNNGGANDSTGGNDNNGGNGSAPPAGTIPVVIDITFDDYPEESGLKLTVQSTGHVITNRPAGSFVGDYTEIFNLPMGQDIDVELTDIFGDGLCCDYGQGGIRVAALISDDEEEELAAEDGRFTSSKIFSFFVPISQQDQGEENNPGDGDNNQGDGGDEGDAGDNQGDGGTVDPIDGDAGTPPPAQGCQDLTDTFTVDSLVGDQDCAWLGVNLGRYNYLCQFLDVAATCQATCEACQYFA